MSPNKKIILKESELIDFISSTVMEVINEGKETQEETLEILKTYVDGDVSDEILLTKIKPQVDKKVKEICGPCLEGMEGELAEQGTITKYVEVVGCTNPRADNYDRDANVDDGSCVITKSNSDYTISTLHPLDKQAGRTQSCMRCHQFTSPFGRTPNASELMWLNQPGFDFDRISWQTIEYAADAIGVIAMFFGPVGWVVSGVAGLVSAYASYEQGNKGTAALTLGLEIIPGFKLFKHFKHLNKFKRVSPDEIGKAFKYFEDPGEAAYKSLTKDSKAIVNYSMKNQRIIEPLLKYSDEVMNARDVIKNIKTINEFVKYATTKSGIKYGLNKLSWVDFQKMQKSLKTSEKIISKVKSGIKTAATIAVVLPPLTYGFILLADHLNKYFLKLSISKTRDWITSSLEGEIYHYRMDRVLEQKYPYKYYACRKNKVTNEPDCERSLTNTYKDMLDGNPLLLLQLWYDDTTYPELKSLSKTADKGEIQGGWAPESCVGVDLNRSPNPGGGWRPNLNCIPGFELGNVMSEQEDAVKAFMAIADDVSLTEDDLYTEVNNLLPNVPESDSVILVKVIEEYREDSNFGLD